MNVTPEMASAVISGLIGALGGLPAVVKLIQWYTSTTIREELTPIRDELAAIRTEIALLKAQAGPIGHALDRVDEALTRLEVRNGR